MRATGGAFGEGQHSRVEHGEDQAEHQDGGPGRGERPGEVGGGDGAPAAERPVRPGGGPHGDDELRGPPHAPQQHPRRGPWESSAPGTATRAAAGGGSRKAPARRTG
ncbi:hypothetical protein GCM10020256_24150 [Streptomyces thermocoprophilus]